MRHKRPARALTILASLLLLAPPTVVLAQQSTAPSGQQILGATQNRATINAAAVITTGGTFQVVLPALISGGTPRQSLTIENNNAGDTCWIYIGSGTATEANSIALGAHEAYWRYWPYVPSDEIQATCGSTNSTIYIDYN